MTKPPEYRTLSVPWTSCVRTNPHHPEAPAPPGVFSCQEAAIPKKAPRPWHATARTLTPDAFYLQLRTWPDQLLTDRQADAEHLPENHQAYLRAEHEYRQRNAHRDPWSTVPTLYSLQAWTTHLKTWTRSRLQQAQAHASKLPPEYAAALTEQYQFRRDRWWIKDTD